MSLLTHWEGEPVGVLAGLWGIPRLEVHDRIASTNDRIRDLVTEAAPPFSVVLAEEQTAGRGRSGQTWHDSPGDSLLFSMLLPRSGAVPLYLPVLVGLAAARAVERAATGLRVGVKWPNDLVVNDRKAGGILCESTSGGVVAGVGINVRQRPGSFPEEIRPRAVSLETAAGARVSRRTLAGSLAGELMRLWRPTSSAALPHEAHLELESRDALRGRAVDTVQEGRGTARGIAPDGALVLERPDGSLTRVVAGSVRAV